jgi:hypothetical protein
MNGVFAINTPFRVLDATLVGMNEETDAYEGTYTVSPAYLSEEVREQGPLWRLFGARRARTQVAKFDWRILEEPPTLEKHYGTNRRLAARTT